ncbi:MAG: hypothetical protein ACO2PN_21145 [Pyrobaculum sp.]
MDVTLIGAVLGMVFLVFLLARRRFDVQAVIYFADGRVAVAKRTAILHDGAELYLADNVVVLAYIRTPPMVVRSFPSGLGLRLLFAEMSSPHSGVATDLTATEARAASYLSLICQGVEVRGCVKQLVEKVSRRTADKLRVALLADEVWLAVDMSPSVVVDVMKSLLLHISVTFRDAANVAEKIYQDYRTTAALLKALRRGGGPLKQILILLIIFAAIAFLLPTLMPAIQGLLPPVPG